MDDYSCVKILTHTPRGPAWHLGCPEPPHWKLVHLPSALDVYAFS